MWTRFDLADHKTFHYAALAGRPLGVETACDEGADAAKEAALRAREAELQAALHEVQVALGQVPTLQHYTVVGIFTDNDQAFVEFYSAASPQEGLSRAEAQQDGLVVVYVCAGVHYGLAGARFSSTATPSLPPPAFSLVRGPFPLSTNVQVSPRSVRPRATLEENHEHFELPGTRPVGRPALARQLLGAHLQEPVRAAPA